MDLESDSGYSTCWVLRCLQCGDMVDETIYNIVPFLIRNWSCDNIMQVIRLAPCLRLLEV